MTGRAAFPLRTIALASVLGLAAFCAGLHLRAPQPRVHPLTGRPIAGIASDARWMDRTERQQEEAPDRALSLIGVNPGMTVADVGAGSGYMTMRLAARVGPAGKVYANDIQPQLLEIIRGKAQANHLTNVELVQGTDVDARLPPSALDLVLLVDVYHEMSHPQGMLRSIRRALKPDGRLAIVEYKKEDPAIPIADTHRMSVRDVRAEVEAGGFRFDHVDDSLPRQHLFVFRNP